MPGQVEAQVLALELERVRDKVPVLFERDNVFYADIEKRPVEVISGRDMRIPLEINPGGRFGSFDSDGGSLGRGGASTFDKGVIHAENMKEAVEWTTKAQWVTDSNRKAVLNNFRYQLAKAMSEFRRNVDALCMTSGDGVLASVQTYSVGTGTAGGDRLTCNVSGDGFGVKLLRYGQKVNIYNAALTTNRTVGNEREINFIDYANKIVDVFPSLATGVTTDKVVLSGLTAVPPVHLLGVKYHHNDASTGFWLGLDRSLLPQVRASSVVAGGALALPYPRLALNKVGDRIGIDNVKKCVAYMHPAQKQAYEELGQLVTIINKTAKDEGLDLYYEDNMQMAGAPVKTSFLWDKARIDFVSKEYWGRAELTPPDFYEVEGRRIFEGRSADGGVAAFMIFYVKAAFNLFVDNPAGCSYIYQLTVPTGY